MVVSHDLSFQAANQSANVNGNVLREWIDMTFYTQPVPYTVQRPPLSRPGYRDVSCIYLYLHYQPWQNEVKSLRWWINIYFFLIFRKALNKLVCALGNFHQCVTSIWLRAKIRSIVIHRQLWACEVWWQQAIHLALLWTYCIWFTEKTNLFSLVIYVIKSDNSQAYILPLTIRLHKMFVIYNVLQGSYADKKNLHFNYNSY